MAFISGNQRTKLRASSPPTSSLWLWSNHEHVEGNILASSPKRMSLSPGIIPKEGKIHCQVLWGDTTALDDSKLHWSVVYLTMRKKKITMKFVKIPYCFHAFFWRSHTSPAFPSLLRTRHDWTIICTKTRRRWESLTSYWPTNREKMPKGNEKEETQIIPWSFHAFR